jgi:hypothetical protein
MITAARRTTVGTDPIAETDAAPPRAAEVDSRARELLRGAAGTNAVAGYGTGVRLEYLLIPMIFGLGAPLVALVGTNIGAGQKQRALRIALVRGAIVFAISETLGLIAATYHSALQPPPSRAPRKAERFFLRSLNRS